MCGSSWPSARASRTLSKFLEIIYYFKLHLIHVTYFVSVRDHNGRPIAAPKKEEPQSHLLDLLDISLGATSISSPPLGAAGGAPAAIVDPWATPGARAPSQLSDPWSGTSSPQVDPWHPNAAPRTIMGAGVPMSSAPPGGATGDAWGARNQSPSVASGSSNEGWLQTNGNANQNGRGATPAGAPVDAWISKSSAGPALAAAPVNHHAANNGGSPADPWLAEPSAAAGSGGAGAGPADPWAGGAAPQSGAAGAGALDDPWRALGTGAIKVSTFPANRVRCMGLSTNHLIALS